jgi:hydroxymethylbilane synthase
VLETAAQAHGAEGLLARSWPTGSMVRWAVVLLGVYLVSYLRSDAALSSFPNLAVTARLAIQPDLAARAPDVLERLLRSGVDVEQVPGPTGGGADADPLRAVRNGHADLALVGLAALRGSAADDLTMLAALPREEPRDALVALAGPRVPLRALATGTRVGVWGPRRTGFLRAHRPDLVAVELSSGSARGLAGAERDVAVAVIAAWEARRAGLALRTVEVLDARSWLPEPGEGIVALLARHPVAEITALDHLPTRTALRAELALVEALDFGHAAAYGSLAQPSGGLLRLWGAVVSLDGTRLVRCDLTGPLDEPEVIGVSVAKELLRRGADLLLEGKLA